MKQTLRNNLYMIGAILVLIGLFAFAMIEGGFVSWFLFYSFFVVVFYITCAYLYPIGKWKVTRLISKTSYEAGDTVDVKIQLKRKFPFPLFYTFCEEKLESSIQRKDESHQKFSDLGRDHKAKDELSFVALLPILFKRTIVLEYSIPYIPRGAHELHMITLKTRDLFGCIKKEAIFNCQDEIYVYPRVRSVMFISESKAYQQDNGTVSSMIKGIQSTMPVGVREYTAGDRLAWIDWKQTAKTNEMMTKEFEHERDTSTLVIFDHLLYNSMNMLAFEGVVETTVAILHHMRKEATHTALLSIGAEVKYMDFEQAGQQTGQVAHHLMQVAPEQGEMFASQIERYSFNLNRKALTCVISSQITEDIIEALVNIHMKSGETMFVCIMPKTKQTIEVHEYFEKLLALGIQVCVLSEKELINEPIEVMTYGTN